MTQTLRRASTIGLLMVMLLLAACGSGSSSPTATSKGQQITLTVSSFYAVDQSSGWKGLVNEFEKTHPGVTVQTQVTASNSYLTKLLSQKASGTMPDVVGVENTPFAEFVDKGMLLDLTASLAKDKNFNKGSFFPKVMDRFTRNGKNYCIPYDAQPIAGLFYNKDLFDKAHVAYPTQSWTWSDMMSAAQKLTVKNGNRVVQYGIDPGDGDWRLFVYAHGGRIVDDYRNPKKVVLDSPQAIEGLKEYASLFTPNQVAPVPNFASGTTSSGVSSADLFVAGKSAMYISGYWEYVFQPQKFSQLKLGYTKIPAGPNGDVGYPTGGTCYGVSSGSKNPDLALDFIKYFMGMPGWKAAFESSPNHVIYPPAYLPAYNSELFLKNPHPPVENLNINGDGAKDAIFNPNDPNWTELSQKTLQPLLDQIVRGQKPVEAIQQIVPQLTAGLAANSH